ncbi:MAG TPA: DNA gyrase inhibitor YacG [Terriglobales bacterium]|nr:DNA gyrase inhibitor YacG [Terriglobales bacterium]
MPKKRVRSLRCPICRTIVLRSDAEFPFCSERCRLTDLGKWASGGYVVSTPIMDPDEFEDAERKLAEERRKSGDGEDSGRRH